MWLLVFVTGPQPSHQSAATARGERTAPTRIRSTSPSPSFISNRIRSARSRFGMTTASATMRSKTDTLGASNCTAHVPLRSGLREALMNPTP